jgi:hypothetical protein
MAQTAYAYHCHDGPLRLNVHPHTLVIDGVYVQDDDSDPLAFVPLPAPTHAEVAAVAGRLRSPQGVFLVNQIEPNGVRAVFNGHGNVQRLGRDRFDNQLPDRGVH